MPDTKLNDFLSSGTAAERMAFTPDPPTPASGPSPGYVWFETDTDDTYAWDAGAAAWVKIASATATGNVTTSATLTAHAVVLGNGTSDITVLGSLGTTTTVLHGNAAGDPSFGAVDLAADVTGVLPAANMATALTVLTSDPVSPSNDTWWVVRSGTSPGDSVALKVQIAGATYTLAEITL